MNKLVLIAFLTACIVATVHSAEPNRKFEFNMQRGGNNEHYKGSLGKVWETRDGKWSAGGYVQHTKDRYPGATVRDTQAGFEINGKFKG